ncbi:MAG: response regulator [Candidatus Obscuribacterales bacterium]|jgi:CheY-like chemotaxis protein
MMTTEPEVEAATPSSRLPAKDTFRILIMDTVEHTDLLKTACKDVGHSVVAAHSIEEAFAFLNGKDHADVIVCAAYLEDESLFDFLRRLRKDPAHKNTMFMTLALAPGLVGSKVNASTEKTGSILGSDVFVSMPQFDASVLIAEIKKLLPATPKLEMEKQVASDSKA